MRVIFANGARLHFTPYELLLIIVRRSSVLTFSVVIAALALFSAYTDLHELTWHKQLVMWVVGVPLFAYLYVSAVCFLDRLSRILRLRAVPEPLIMFIATAIITFILMPLAAELIGNPAPTFGESARFVFYNFLLWEVAALLYFSFVFPNELSKLRKRKSDNAVVDILPRAEVVQIGDKSYLLDELIHVSAMDHYLKIVTQRGSDLALTQLSAFAQSVEPGYGTLVHRSHWVSFRHISRISRENNRVFLQLSNNTSIPLARSKQKDLMHHLSALRINFQ